MLRRTVDRVTAVDGSSFSVKAGDTLGLVEESGCGKTTVGRTILRLIPATSGKVTFDQQAVFSLKGSALKQYRRQMQIIFQDPFSSLDPRMPIGQSIVEGLDVHGIGSRKDRHEVVADMLNKVEIGRAHV